MTVSLAYFTHQPLALPEDDPFVLHARGLRRGFRLEDTSRYSDDIWRLYPAQLKEHERALGLNFPTIPARFRPAAKKLFYNLLSGPLPDGEDRMEIASVRGTFTSLKRFLVWLDKRWPADRLDLSELTGSDLDDYRKHLLIAIPDSPDRRQTVRAAPRLLWRWRANLDADCLLFDPLHLDGWSDSRKGRHRENATPRIPEPVLGTLIGWALRFVDHFADDILRANQRWWALRRPRAEGHYRRGEVATALRHLLDQHIAQGRPLPGIDGRLNAHHVGRLLHLGGDGDTSTLTENYQADLDEAVAKVGITATTRLDTAIRADLDGAPWLDGIDFNPRDANSLARLARHLQAACYAAIAFLSGIRDSEVKHLRRGCLHIQRDADGNAYRWKVASLAFKDEVTEGVPAVWTVGEPVARAIAVLEALQPAGTDFLFARLAHDSGSKQGSGKALLTGSTNRQLNEFVAWINQYCTDRGRHDGIPPENKQAFRLKTSHFRRTLAWFVARRPGGVIAGALQFRHHSIQMFEGYAGTSDSGFRAEVESEQAMARGEVYMEMIEGHPHPELTGPSAAEAAVRLKDFAERAQYQGKIALDESRLKRIMKRDDPAIYPGEYITCVHSAPTALCEKAKRGRGEGLPDHGGCLPLACRNVALAPANTLAWQRELGRIERRLDDRPRLPPLLRARLIARHGEIAEFLTSNGIPVVTA